MHKNKPCQDFSSFKALFYAALYYKSIHKSIALGLMRLPLFVTQH
jgi:hypothetical protein